MGIIPIWGFQLITAIFLSILFRLNKALVIIAANITFPPMIPFVIFLSYKVGGYCIGGRATNIEYSKMFSIKEIKNNFTQYLYGSIVLAIVAGIAFGLLTFVLLKLFKRKSISVG